jgi:molecular chaperone DnaK
MDRDGGGAAAIRLGIDFGTSHTVGVIALPGREPRTLLFNGGPLLPSAIHAAAGGRLLVGRDAQHIAVADPGAFEPHPKRCIDDGTVLLGDVETPVTELIAAVLGRVSAEAVRVAGETPTDTVLTVPAAWGSERRQTLLTAAAGLPNVRLVAEPVAAATYYVEVAGGRVPVGQPVMVYDFGAGTFDATVIRRTDTGFEVLATEGLPDCGGLDIDAAIVAYVGSTLAARDEERWHRLEQPGSTPDRRAARQLWDGVREAKEMLSEHPSALIHVPLFDVELPLGREQLELLAAPIIDRTVASCRSVLRTAGVEAGDLAAVFLTGGSSRMPVVGTSLHRAFGLAPTAVDQPELAVAEGSVRILDRVPVADSGWPIDQLVVEFGPPAPPVRRRRWLPVGAAVAALVLLGVGAVALNGSRRPGSASAPGPSGDNAALVASTSPSTSPSPTYRAGIDGCLVGTWSQITAQKQNTIDNAKVQFNGGSGGIRTFDLNGRFTEDFTPAEPLVAVVNSNTWQERAEGSASGTYQARNGVLLYSDVAASGTWRLLRNGRVNRTIGLNFSVEPEQYVCDGDQLTIAASFYTSRWKRIG